MCLCKSIAKGKLCGPESLPDAVFLNEVLTDCLSAISRFDMGMHLIDCLAQLSMPHVVPMDHCQHNAQRKNGCSRQKAVTAEAVAASVHIYRTSVITCGRGRCGQ